MKIKKYISRFIIFAVLILNMDFSYSQIKNCNLTLSEKVLYEKLDNGSNFLSNCEHKYKKKESKFIDKINNFSNEKILCILKKSSYSIYFIIVKYYFKSKRKLSSEIKFFFVEEMEGEIITLCRRVGYSDFFDFIVSIYEHEKNNHPTLYEIFKNRSEED